MPVIKQGGSSIYNSKMTNQTGAPNYSVPNSLQDPGLNPIDQKCQVCFTDPKHQQTCQGLQLVTCRGCTKIAHRRCYDSTIKGDTFECDLCSPHQRKLLNKNCTFCLNDGLLKNVGMGRFAHPVCCLVYYNVKPVQYQTLSFKVESSIQLPGKQKKECQLCHKSTEYMDNCHHQNCFRKSHLYCTLKHQNQEVMGWMQRLQIFNKSGQNRTQAPKKERRLLCCPQHNALCVCVPQSDETGNYIMCDQCLRWYHSQCLHVNASDYGDKEFYCKYCKHWNSCQNPTDYTQRVYPRLHFYDFVGILISQEKSDKQGFVDLIQRFPFKCIPRVYFGQTVAITQDEVAKLTEKIACVFTLEEIEQIEISPNLLETVAKGFNIKSEKHKKSKKSSRKQCRASDLNELIKQIHAERLPSQFSRFMYLFSNLQDYKINLEYIVSIVSKELTKTNRLKMYSRLIDLVQTARKRCNSKGIKIEIEDQLGIFKFINQDISQQKKTEYLEVFKLICEMAELGKDPRNQHGIDYQFFMTNISSRCYRLNQESFKTLLPFYSKYMSELVDTDRVAQREYQFLDNLLGSIEEIQVDGYQHLKSKLTPIWNSEKADLLEQQYTVVKIIMNRYSQLLKYPPEKGSVKKLKQFIEDVENTYVVKPMEPDLKTYRNYISEYQTLQIIVGKIQAHYCNLGMHFLTPFEKYDCLIKSIRGHCEMVKEFPQLILDFGRQISTLIGVKIQPSFKKALAELYQWFLDTTDHQSVCCRSLSLILKNIDYLDIKYRHYNLLAERNQEYRDWVFYYQQVLKPGEVPGLLENPNKTKELLQNVRKVDAELNARKLNVPQQAKTLKIVQVWCKISLKLAVFLKSKPTPGAIRQLYQIVTLSGYPKTVSMYSNLYALHDKVLQFEKLTQKFVVRKRTQRQEIEVFRELSAVQEKLKERQVESIVGKLSSAHIDYSFELGDIGDDLEQFRRKLLELTNLPTANNLDQLNRLFKFFLYDTPLRYQNFAQLRDRLRSLQCQSTPKTKKDFDRLMSWGGPEVAELSERCKSNLVAYKKLTQIQQLLLEKRVKQYPTNAQMQIIRLKVFQHDIKKRQVKEWMQEFQKLQKVVQDLRARSRHRKYTAQLLRHTIDRYQRVPIRTQNLGFLKDNLQTIQRIQKEFKQEVLDDWLQNIGDKTVYSEQRVSQYLQQIVQLNEMKATIPELTWLFRLLQKYRQVTTQVLDSHQDYIDFLRLCEKLGPKFQTKALLRKRVQNFIANKSLMAQCATRQEAEPYYFECHKLLNMGQPLITKAMLQGLQNQLEKKPGVIDEGFPGYKRQRINQQLQLLGDGGSEEDGDQDQDCDNELGSNEVSVISNSPKGSRETGNRHFVIDSSDE